MQKESQNDHILISQQIENNQSPSTNKSKRLNKLYQSIVYFSPFKHSTQNQVIDEIKSLGQEILTFQQTSMTIQYKKNKNNNTKRSNSTFGNHNFFTNRSISHLDALKENINKPRFAYVQQAFTHSLTKSKQQSIELKKYKTQKNKQKHNLQSSQNIIKDKKQNLYDKYKQETKLKKTKIVQNKVNQLIKLQRQHKIKSPVIQQKHPIPQTQLNYTRYIDRNIKKLLKQSKPTNQSKDSFPPKPNQKPFIKVYDAKKQAYIKRQKIIKANPEQINKLFNNVFNKGQHTMQRKHQKVMFLRSQIIKKENQHITFKPKLITNNFNKKSIENQFKSKNFQERLQIDMINRNTHEKQIIAELMQKSPFKPKLNPSSKMTQSIVKSAWSSHYTSVTTGNRRSIEKFKNSILRSEISIDSGIGQISLNNTYELNFLLN